MACVWSWACVKACKSLCRCPSKTNYGWVRVNSVKDKHKYIDSRKIRSLQAFPECEALFKGRCKERGAEFSPYQDISSWETEKETASRMTVKGKWNCCCSNLWGRIASFDFPVCFITFRSTLQGAELPLLPVGKIVVWSPCWHETNENCKQPYLFSSEIHEIFFVVCFHTVLEREKPLNFLHSLLNEKYFSFQFY